MSKSAGHASTNLAIVFSRIQVAAFLAVTGGVLVLTLANALGEEVVRSVMLGMLTIVFVIGGGLIGLIAMQHVSQTHLPDEAEQELEDFSLMNTNTPQAQPLRGRGFLGMFSLSEDASRTNHTDGDDFRRTA